MTVRIEGLSPESGEEYDAFLAECPGALLYYSRKYRAFLQRVLRPATAQYLAAYESSRLSGIFPAFVLTNPGHGAVVNSLPFFGSHGGILCSPSAADPHALKRALAGGFGDLCEAQRAAASTVIVNPLLADDQFYERHLPWTYRDTRIGQIAPLPRDCRSDAEIDEKLFLQFHHKTRNCVRKARKSEIRVSHSGSTESLRALAELHWNAMRTIDGMQKSWEVFLALQDAFTYDADYRIYLGHKDDRVVAALLVFYFHGSAEYFIPATDSGYRVFQPMSLLVFEAMKEAVRRGCTCWNWGGTWNTQDGVYHFKRRWGTEDRPYTYYVSVRDPAILTLDRETLLAAFPYFYVVPFDKLKGAGTPDT